MTLFQKESENTHEPIYIYKKDKGDHEISYILDTLSTEHTPGTCWHV